MADMIRALRTPLVTAVVLSFLPTPAASQSCYGMAPFTEGPLRLGVSYARPGNAGVRTGRVAFGELANAFVDASYSRIKPLAGPGADIRGYEYGALAGLDWHVRRTRGLYFCPTLEVHRGRRNSVLLMPLLKAGDRTDDHFTMAGGALAPSSGVHGGVVISPTAGAWFARDRSAGAAGATTVTRDYGIARVGLGLVILKRYSASIGYEREFGTAAVLPGFAVGEVSIDIGKGTPMKAK